MRLSMPVKRTALGRFRHECAAYGKPVVGKPLVFYMGDDPGQRLHLQVRLRRAVGEADATAGLAAGDKYLNAGQAVRGEVQRRRHRYLAAAVAGEPAGGGVQLRLHRGSARSASTRASRPMRPAPPRWIARSGLRSTRRTAMCT